MHRIESLCSTPESDITLYVTSTSIIKFFLKRERGEERAVKKFGADPSSYARAF